MAAYCPVCGAEVATSRVACEKCGAALPDTGTWGAQTPRQAELNPVPPLALLTPASRAKRLFAGAVDFAVVQALVYVVYFVIPRKVGLSRSRGILGLIIMVWLAAPLYAVLRDSIGGKSLGKMLFGLSVVNVVHRRRGGLSESLLRNAILSVVLIPVVGPVLQALLCLVIGAQIAIGSDQRVGDRMASTQVVDDALSDLP